MTIASSPATSEPDDRRPGFRAQFRAFARTHVAPLADQIDVEERIPHELIARLAAERYLARGIPPPLGGEPGDATACGVMHEELAYASSSVEGLVNVHHMASETIARWGDDDQRRTWMPSLAAGERLAAFAITEPLVGSDAKNVTTAARQAGADFVLDGHKKWISFGQIADVFVLLARAAEGPAVFLVPRECPGLRIAPISGLLGCRGYMLAELHLDGCRIPASHLLGKVGFGFSHVITTGLNVGRHNLAWGCVGMAQACLDAALEHARTRIQFGSPIGDLELVQRMISRMVADVGAARLLCLRASRSRSMRSRQAILDAAIAKYFASQVVSRAAADTVQIHGAIGVSSERPVQRYFRDAKIMEIVEGTTQILETVIARFAVARGDGQDELAAALEEPGRVEAR